MKETRFIIQNKEKWKEAEILLKNSEKNPEKLSNLFIEIVDDLSYSKTYYPNRSVRVYLNKIAKQYFSIISRYGKKNHSFKLFWLDELPQIIYLTRRRLITSFLFFLLAVTIGVFSSAHQPDFAGSILGPDYIEMTKKNIDAGDPMAVYKQSQQMDMFLGITLNNLYVAFRTYVLGIFLGLGTLASLLYNGIMVGCFQYYFVERGLLAESALTIWLHGTLEISSIILAGGAGLTLGSGLIFPGTYSRLQSLQISGIRSLKIMLGITPVFVFAAFIESFLTRYTDAPVIVKGLLIFLSFAFIVGYFVVYPWLKSKKGFAMPLKEVRLPPSDQRPVSYTTIKNNADLLKDAFLFYSRNSTKIFPWIAVISIGISLLLTFLATEVPDTSGNDWFIELLSGMFSALRMPSPLFILTNSMAVSLVLFRAMQLLDAESKGDSFKFNFLPFIRVFVITAIAFVTIYYLDYVGIFLVVVALGFLFLTAFVQVTEQGEIFFGLGRGFELFTANGNQGITLQLILSLLSVSFLIILSAPLFYIHTSVLTWNFSDEDQSKTIIVFLKTFIEVFAFYCLVPLLSACAGYLYFSQEEISSAKTLQDNILKLNERHEKRARR